MRASQTLRHLVGPLELIHEQAGPRLLGLTRLGVILLWIFKLSLDPLWRLTGMPREMFQPIGLLLLLPDGALTALLTTNGLVFLWTLTLASLAFCLANRAFPLAATVAAILVTVYSCLIRSFGPAVHTDIVLILALYVLAGFAWADTLSTGPNGKKSLPAGSWSSFPLVTIVALLCLSYMLVGMNRTMAGGLRVFTGDTMEYWAIDASLRGYYFNTEIGWHIPEWPLALFMLRSGLPIITLFEMAAPLCLVCPHFRWVFIPVMLSFHLLSLVFMNIFFFDDMLLYLLLIDWSRRFSALRARQA